MIKSITFANMQISKWMIFIFVIGLFACQTETEVKESLTDYFILKSSGSVTYRTYKNMSDSTGSGILIRQSIEQESDSVWKMEYLWMNMDSVPFNHSIERMHNGRSIEIVEQSFYETDSAEGVHEMKVNILSKRLFSIDNAINTYDGQYKSYRDTALRLSFHSNFSSSFEFSEKWQADVYKVNAKDYTDFEYSDGRKNNAVMYESERIYVKGRGLVEFSQTHKGETTVYKIIESH